MSDPDVKFWLVESARRTGVRFSDHYEREELADGRVLMRLVELGIVVVGDSEKEAKEAFDAAFLDLATADSERVLAFMTKNSKPLEPLDVPRPSVQVEEALPAATSLGDLADPSRAVTVVDFWAVWCVPCRAIETALVGIANDFPKVAFRRVEVEANPHLAQHFEVRSLPTVVVLKFGTEVARVVGAKSEAALREILDL